MDTERKNPNEGGKQHIEVKKSAKANLEKKKSTGLLIGFVAVFAFLYIALEFTTVEMKTVQEAVENKAVEQQSSELMEFRIYRPPQPKVEMVKPTEIKEQIKILEEDSDEEESELLAPEDSGYEDVVEVDYVGDVMVEEEVQEEEIFIAVSKQASFPGGMQKMYEYLGKNIKYPAVSRNNGSEGKTTLRFVVEKDGSITRVEILKSSGDAFLDKEAVRVVSTMPKWQPADQNGRTVRSYFVLPVQFKLQ